MGRRVSINADMSVTERHCSCTYIQPPLVGVRRKTTQPFGLLSCEERERLPVGLGLSIDAGESPPFPAILAAPLHALEEPVSRWDSDTLPRYVIHQDRERVTRVGGDDHGGQPDVRRSCVWHSAQRQRSCWASRVPRDVRIYANCVSSFHTASTQKRTWGSTSLNEPPIGSVPSDRGDLRMW